MSTEKGAAKLRKRLAKENRLGRYLDRQEFVCNASPTYVCENCRKAFSGAPKTCPNCKGVMLFVPVTEEVPRKKASNKKWKEFMARIYKVARNQELLRNT